MRKHTVAGFLFLALAIVFPCESNAQHEFPWSPLGRLVPRHASEISGSRLSVGAETMDRDYTIYANWKDYLGPLGVKKARIQGGWAKTERERGVYDWTWLDEIIFDMNEQGVEPWVCLCYGNPLYADGGGVRLGADLPKTEEALQAWEAWVAAFVERYQNIVDEWEVWNEPMLRDKNAPEDYARLLIRTARAIREVQPDATVIAFAMAGVRPDRAETGLNVLREENALGLIDEVSYHPYSKNPDDSYDRVQELRETVKSFSLHLAIRQGENGAPSEFRKTKALSNYDWTELSQAKWALRRLLGDLARGIETSYFAIADMKYPDEINRKGLLKTNDEKQVEYPKPAYFAVQHLAAIFDEHITPSEGIHISSNAERSLSAFGFHDNDSRTQVVAFWFDDDIPSDDNAGTPVDLNIHGVSFTHPVHVDLRTGLVFEIPDGEWRRDGDLLSFSDVPVYDSPVLIVERSAIDFD